MTHVYLSPDYFQGAVSIEHGTGWVQPWRIQIERKMLFPSPEGNLLSRASSPSGVRLRFFSSSPRVKLVLEPLQTEPDEPRIFDLVSDGEIISTYEQASEEQEVPFALDNPSGDPERIWEIWMPPFHPVRPKYLVLEDGCSIGALPDSRLRWTTYGSSITMCRGAHSPARTWPAVVSRGLKLNLTSLGYGGQCHLDPMVARIIRDLPADVITVKTGINIFGAASLTARSYQAALIGLIQSIRDGHPRTPIGIITAIYSSLHDISEPTINSAGLSLENYREMTRDAFNRLVQSGDSRLLLFEGSDLLKPDEAEALKEDGVHPSGEGYELIGKRATEIVLPPLIAMSS